METINIQEDDEVESYDDVEDSDPLNSPNPLERIHAQEEIFDEETEALLSPEEREERRCAKRPDISWLKPAIENGNFIPRKGMYLVMERKNLLIENKPWLDTKVYRLLTDPDADGNIRLFDCVSQNNALLNWKTALVGGFDLRLPPSGRNPELLFVGRGKRRRRRKLQKPQEAPVVQPATPVDPTIPQKRKRGRPKGSKNKPRQGK